MLKKAWGKIFIVNVSLCQFYKYESERNMDIFGRKTWGIHKTENIKTLQVFFTKTVGLFFLFVCFISKNTKNVLLNVYHKT